MASSEHEIIGHILTWISLIHALIACMISILIIIIIMYHALHNRLRYEDKITLILCTNIYLVVFMYGLTLSITNIETLLNDLYDRNPFLPWCILNGYWIIVSAHTMYYTFVVQAVFRLFRIVYSKYRWLQSKWIFIISTPVHIVLGSILICPLLVWNDIVYISNNHYCFVLFTKARGILWALSDCYLLPYICLLGIYIRITSFLRQQAGALALVIRRRHQRDLQAVRRIYMNVVLLCVLSFPAVVVLIISLITGVEYSFSHRIVWLVAEISLAILSIQIVFMTPQLKNIIIRRWQRNRVRVIGLTDARPAGTAQ